MFAAATRRALILVPLVVSACASTQRVPLAPQTSRELRDYSVVELRTGRRVRLANGRLTADSVLGERESGGRFAVSRDSVTTVEESSLSVVRTLGLLGGIALGAFALLALALAAAGGIPVQ